MFHGLNIGVVFLQPSGPRPQTAGPQPFGPRPLPTIGPRVMTPPGGRMNDGNRTFHIRGRWCHSGPFKLSSLGSVISVNAIETN